jgi:hypothetical protein
MLEDAALAVNALFGDTIDDVEFARLVDLAVAARIGRRA